jgi:hypothetical protein
MSLLRNLSDGLRSLFRKKRVEGELDEELRGFLEIPHASRWRNKSVDRQRSCQISWSESANCVSLGGAKADSPSPRNGSQHPVSQNGSRNIPRVLQTGDGECLGHESTMVWFIGGLAPKSGGFDIGTVGVSPGENRARPLIGRKQTRSSEKDFRRETTIYLKS